MSQFIPAVRIIPGCEYVLGGSFDEFDDFFMRGLRLWKNISLTDGDGKQYRHDIYLFALRKDSDESILFEGYLLIDNRQLTFTGISKIPHNIVTIRFSQTAEEAVA